jgi:hypothetical protein
MQTLQGKISMYDYYSALEKLTDNTGLQLGKVRNFFEYLFPAMLLMMKKIQDCYKSFMRVMREWRFLKMQVPALESLLFFAPHAHIRILTFQTTGSRVLMT